MPGSVIVGGARTPIGRLLGSLKDFSGPDLGGFAIKAALERAGVAADKVDYVIMGQVLQAGAGQITARQAAVKAGLPMNVPALTINKVCLSGLDSIALADQLINAGEFDIVVAGGMESMTQAPHLLPNSRSGFKYGDTTLVDSMAYDGLWDVFTDAAMGELTEKTNAKLNISREEQDEFSAQSHQRAAAAHKNGVFDDEIVTIEIPQRKGDPLSFREDEGVRGDTTTESLSKLKPAFAKDGTITAGSASQISDGAAAVVVMSKAKADELGATVLAEIGHHGASPGLTRRCSRSRRRRSRRLPTAPVSRRAASTSTRSTRRSPLSRSSRCATSASPTTRSTSTVARSHSATRSAYPVPGWRCTSPSSCSDVVAAPASPRCAAAAARAMR